MENGKFATLAKWRKMKAELGKMERPKRRGSRVDYYDRVNINLRTDRLVKLEENQKTYPEFKINTAEIFEATTRLMADIEDFYQNQLPKLEIKLTPAQLEEMQKRFNDVLSKMKSAILELKEEYVEESQTSNPEFSTEEQMGGQEAVGDSPTNCMSSEQRELVLNF
jgi:predicted nuclease with TOPRIM domain